MANVRTARLLEREPVHDGALLRFALSDGEPLGFRGGQYVIVDTGLELPDGKRRKRAYSLCSDDRDQMSFELGVYPVHEGLGAAYMLGLAEGDELRFSGPWGKLSPPSDDPRPLWVLATDTGITAALGLVRGAAYAEALSRTKLCWWTGQRDYFLSRELVERRLPRGLALHEGRLPQVGSPERSIAVEAQLGSLLGDGEPALVYVTGDGQAPAWVRAFLDAHGLAATPVQTENFFHHPVRKAAQR